ncbi:MAG: hypothetical protein LV479_11645 [Methylacidiphilales bacterium]|nr:hypothetical protein [Candidatus Methylacidiphilales bacterium]
MSQEHASRHEPFEVLEIACDSFFQIIFPDRTTHVAINHSRGRLERGGKQPITLRKLRELLRDVSRGRYSLIVVGGIQKVLWNRHRSLFKNIVSVFQHLAFPASLTPYFVIRIASAANVSIIAYDVSDTMLISSEYFFLFPHIRAFFKREISQNRWHVFLSTTPKNGDVTNIRRQRLFQEAIAKIHPLPLHVGPERYDFREVRAEEKTTDIFYVGENPKTTVRTDGVRLLAELQKMGVVVDIPDERISPDEFKKRLARSWLAWSPEGSGWECGRHYESIICGTVPVINYPTIYRYKPLVDGVHALYYGCEEKDLIRVVTRALEDKKALLTMIHNARAHLQQWYANTSVGEYILRESGLAKG